MTKKKITPLSAVAAVLMLVSAVLSLGIWVTGVWSYPSHSIRYWFYYSFQNLSYGFITEIGTVLTYIAILISAINAIFIFLNKRNYFFTVSLVVCSISLFYSYCYWSQPKFRSEVGFYYVLFIAIAYLFCGAISFLCIRNRTSRAANLWRKPLSLSAVASSAVIFFKKWNIPSLPTICIILFQCPYIALLC